ncbi:hypothetical protein PAPYR_478 [Paratrimastix pyriformis]|uniref:Protein kinase domain-containing protein n=1 Tax=Paratrimastix pyriformis TaxID=342808 RepID=A0ABQ8UTN7_9EUKA|nr:hypothetical protein PAPYR_478 [Paratrimastix pyriformis]
MERTFLDDFHALLLRLAENGLPKDTAAVLNEWTEEGMSNFARIPGPRLQNVLHLMDVPPKFAFVIAGFIDAHFPVPAPAVPAPAVPAPAVPAPAVPDPVARLAVLHLSGPSCSSTFQPEEQLADLRRAGYLVDVSEAECVSKFGFRLYPEEQLAPYDIAAVFEIKKATFNDRDLIQALGYAKALLSAANRPQALVALCNTRDIQFVRATRDEQATVVSYILSPVLSMGAPTARSFLYYLLTSEELLPRILRLEEYSVYETDLVSSTRNSQVVGATFSHDREQAQQLGVLKTVKLTTRYIENEVQTLRALAQEGYLDSPRLVASVDTKLLLVPRGERIQWSRSDRKGVPLTRTLVGQFVDALQLLHQIGFTHGDLRPSNLLAREGRRAFLIDFGVATKIGDPRDLHGDLLYRSDRLLAGKGPKPQDDEAQPKAQPQDDAESLVKTMTPIHRDECCQLRQCKNAASVLQFWQDVALRYSYYQIAMAEARANPIDYSKLKAALLLLVAPVPD